MAGGNADKDVAIVGAGAAGLAAGRRLVEAGLEVAILEARDRIGGRAWTVEARPGLPVDLGCEWLHCADRNPLVQVARTLGFEVDEHPEFWTTRSSRLRLGQADYDDIMAALEDFWAKIEACGEANRDVACSELFDPKNRWHPWLDCAMGRIAGASLAEVSALDQARLKETDFNWRVPAGYGSVIARYGAGLPVTQDAPVTRIDWSGAAVALDTPKGRVTAKTVVLALPASLIADGAVTFTPALPPTKQEAAANLPLGSDLKVFLAADGKPFGGQYDMQYSGRFDRNDSGHYHIHPFGHPIVEAYYGGQHAKDLEAAGPAAMLDFAMEELADVFGAEFRGELSLLTHSTWMADPWARGAYSYAKPGWADARATLAAPLEDRLFFAGEATSIHDGASCNGAYQSGLDAAEALLAAFGQDSRTGMQS